MKKFRQVLCSKRAFTLIETVVASAVSSIVLIGVLSFIVPTGENMEKTKNINDAKIVSEMIIAELEKNIRYAKTVVIKDSGGGSVPAAATGTVAISQQEVSPASNPYDILHIDRGGTMSQLVAESFYDRIRCDITFTPVSPGGGLIVTIEAHLPNRTQILSKTEQVIKIYNGVANLDAGITEGDYIVATFP